MCRIEKPIVEILINSNKYLEGFSRDTFTNFQLSFVRQKEKKDKDTNKPCLCHQHKPYEQCCDYAIKT